MRATLIAAAALAAAAVVPAFAQDAGNGQPQTQLPTTGQEQHGQRALPTVIYPSDHIGTSPGQSGTDRIETPGQLQHAVPVTGTQAAL
jgi:hypothetical protein